MLCPETRPLLAAAFPQRMARATAETAPRPGCCKRPAEDGRTRLVGNDLADIAGLLLALEVFVTNQCPVLERLDAAPDLAPLRALWKRNLGGLEKIAVVLFLCSSSDHAAQER